MDFLRGANLGRPASIGARVAVIGGGNSAIDAASAARRIGKNVRVLYRRTRQEIPALPEQVVALEEEGIEVQFLAAPRRAVSGAGGESPCRECIRMKLGDGDEGGRRRPVPLEGSESTVDRGTVISAIGQKPAVGDLVSGTDLGVTRWDTLEVEPETLVTALDGVIAGGDVVTGPGAVTPSMAHGKIIARVVKGYLEGRPAEREYNVMRPAVDVPVAELAEDEVQERRRSGMPLLSMAGRWRWRPRQERGPRSAPGSRSITCRRRWVSRYRPVTSPVTPPTRLPGGSLQPDRSPASERPLDGATERPLDPIPAVWRPALTGTRTPRNHGIHGRIPTGGHEEDFA